MNKEWRQYLDTLGPAEDERCRTCGTFKVVNPKTGRKVCPARASHTTKKQEAAIWRSILYPGK